MTNNPPPQPLASSPLIPTNTPPRQPQPPLPSSNSNKAQAAALNNAHYITHFLSAHNVHSHIIPSLAWRCPCPLQVRFTPNVVTLGGAEGAEEKLALVRQLSQKDEFRGRRWGVKDSFRALNEEEMRGIGFEVIVEGEWVLLGAEARVSVKEVMGEELKWEGVGFEVDEVVDADGLREFELAWEGNELLKTDVGVRHFQNGLLSVNEIKVTLVRSNGHVVAGCIANNDAGAVGITNMFVALEDPLERRQLKTMLLGRARTLFLGRELLGWAHGKDLEEMMALGFESVGKMRVWETRPD